MEMELAAARAAQESITNGSPVSDEFNLPETVTKRKYLMVFGINTAFNSRKRRDSVRTTWMPPGNVYLIPQVSSSSILFGTETERKPSYIK